MGAVFRPRVVEASNIRNKNTIKTKRDRTSTTLLPPQGTFSLAEGWRGQRRIQRKISRIGNRAILRRARYLSI
jgi:hypothetical protein